MNPRRLTPSMSLLLSFESAARHLSFTRAAEELSLTPSAVSRQVQALEQMLEVALFQRTGRLITLTAAGALYLRELSVALARIRNATLQVTAHQSAGGALHLACLPTFASKWLLPRLSDFYTEHPDMLVHIHSRIGEIDMDIANMDAVINAGDGHWDGMISHRLMGEELLLVASPALLARRPIRRAEDIADHALLQISSRPDLWHNWSRSQGLSSERLRPGPQFEVTSHLIQAAVAGIGIGLVARQLCEEECQSGALRAVLEGSFPSALSYYFSYPPQKQSMPALPVFRDWLLRQRASNDDIAAE